MCFKRRHSVPHCVPDIATWSYQTHGFHLLITSWHIFPVHHSFHFVSFFAFSLICLPYINKLFVMKMSCLLPRAKLLRVTFFMKRSYLIPRENFKLPYLPNQAYWDPFALNWDLVTSILYTQFARFHPRELCVFSPYLCRLIQPRPRGEEGNCSYLLSLLHRDCSEYKRILALKWRTSHGVLWRTCNAILKPVYRNLTCGDATRMSRVASSYWPMYNHKVTIITSIPIFIQMAALSYFQYICINKISPIIAHLLSIHPIREHTEINFILVINSR